MLGGVPMLADECERGVVRDGFEFVERKGLDAKIANRMVLHGGTQSGHTSRKQR